MSKKISVDQGRSVEEWSSDNPDAKVPARVRLRILRRFNSICQLSFIKIAEGQPWDVEHKIALSNGGKHAESNMVPVLRLPHEIKTAAERKRQAKADRVAKRAHGLTESKQKIQSRGFEPSSKTPRINKAELPALPRRSLYRDA